MCPAPCRRFADDADIGDDQPGCATAAISLMPHEIEEDEAHEPD